MNKMSLIVTKNGRPCRDKNIRFDISNASSSDITVESTWILNKNEVITVSSNETSAVKFELDISVSCLSLVPCTFLILIRKC